jgi:hypothetical protein
MPTKYIPGSKFGRLTLIKRTKIIKGRYFAFFKCDCGKEKELSMGNVFSGGTRSCGCLRKDRIPQKKHGLAKSRFYHIWSGVYCRCCKKYGHNHDKYKANGIDIYPKWHKFQGFIDDNYQSYLKHVEEFGEADTTFNRIDTAKGFWPDNVKWGTHKERVRKTEKYKKIIENGVEVSVSDFCKKWNIRYSSFRNYTNNGLTPDDIVSFISEGRPNTKRKDYKEVVTKNMDIFNGLSQHHKDVLTERLGLKDGVTKTLKQTGKIFGITRERVRQIEDKSIQKIVEGIK